MGGSLERAQSLPLSWGRGLVGRDGQEGPVAASRSAPPQRVLSAALGARSPRNGVDADVLLGSSIADPFSHHITPFSDRSPPVP